MPVNEDAFLASQCLDFCQMLAGKSSSFSFSLKIGTNFSFSLDTRGEAASSFAKKKKKTPSTLRMPGEEKSFCGKNLLHLHQFLKKELKLCRRLRHPCTTIPLHLHLQGGDK